VPWRRAAEYGSRRSPGRRDIEGLSSDIEYFVVPPLCPLVGSPYDFSRTSDHIERAIRSTDAWLAQSGLERGGIPDEMRPHSH
jgi:NTE family protein